jgi:hypothetical protein
MQDAGLDAKAVEAYMASHPAKVGTLRYRHVLAIQSCKEPKIAVVDISQAPNRAAPRRADESMPCITPGGKKFFPKSDRYMLTEEALIMQGYDVSALDFGCNTDTEPRP